MPQVKKRVILTDKGKEITITSTRDKGGMGALWLPEPKLVLSNGMELVLKIYRRPPPKETIKKLKGMIPFATTDLCEFTGWPLSLARDKDSKEVIGYLMPSFQNREALEIVSKPKSLSRVHNKPNWKFGAYTAINLAHVVSLLHSKGIVYGDLNPKNFMVDLKTAHVCALDMDSVQIKAGNDMHYVDALHPQWRSPEFIKPVIGKTEFTQEHDNFLLAMHIFRLLCYGNHPFSPVYDDDREVDQLNSIKGRHYAYDPDNAKRHKIQPVYLAVIPGSLSLDLHNMFVRAFLPRQEVPTAHEWEQFLKKFVPAMQDCARNKAHAHLPNEHCHFCDIEDSVSGKVRLYNSKKKKMRQRSM